MMIVKKKNGGSCVDIHKTAKSQKSLGIQELQCYTIEFE